MSNRESEKKSAGKEEEDEVKKKKAAQKKKTWFNRFINHYHKQYVEYVTCKEDMHELTYRQAERGFLKRGTFIFTGSMLRMAYLFIVVYLTYSNYVSLKYTSQFVSLDMTAGDCQEVPKTYVLPNIAADLFGNWEVSKDFNPSESTVVFSLFNFQVTNEEYTQWMKDVNDEIRKVGEKAKEQNLAVNMLYWSFWGKSVPVRGKEASDSSYTIRFTGEPNSILNLDNIRGTLANVKYMCDPKIVRKQYDPANGELSAVMSYNAFSSKTEVCYKVVDASSVGYEKFMSGDEFRLSIDVTSALASIAVNYGIVDDSFLVYIAQYGVDILYNDKTYIVSKYYHKRYASGKIFYCSQPTDSVDVKDRRCVIRIGATFAIPFFQSNGIGNSFNLTGDGTGSLKPRMCDCSNPDARINANNTKNKCNDFDFLIGVFMYDIKASAVGTPRAHKGPWADREMAFIPILELFYGGYPNENGGKTVNATDPKDLNHKIFEAAYFSIAQGEAEKDELAYYENSTNRNSVWNPFKTSFGEPFILSFRMNSKFEKRTINVASHEIQYGSCNDTFSYDNFKNLYEPNEAFGLLTEPYYTCTQYPSDAFINGAGVASGLVGLFLPVFVYLLMTTLMLPNVFKGQKYVEIIDENDEDDDTDDVVETKIVQDDKIIEKDGDLESLQADLGVKYKAANDYQKGMGVLKVIQGDKFDIDEDHEEAGISRAPSAADLKGMSVEELTKELETVIARAREDVVKISKAIKSKR